MSVASHRIASVALPRLTSPRIAFRFVPFHFRSPLTHCVPRLACRISFLIIVINARLLITIKCWLLLSFFSFSVIVSPFFLCTGYFSSLFHTSVLCPFWGGNTIKHLINTIKASDLARRTSLKEMPTRGSKDKDDNDNDNEDDIKINIKQKGSDKRKPAKAVGDETCLQLPERYKSGIKTFFYEPKFKPAHKHTLALVRGEGERGREKRNREGAACKRGPRGRACSSVSSLARKSSKMRHAR